MGEPAAVERRTAERLSITGKIPAKLSGASGEEITFYPVDVSASGLGLLFDREVKVDETLVLRFAAGTVEEVKLRVVWQSRPYPQLDVVRCGLELIDESINLEKTLSSLDSVYLERIIC